MIDDGIMDRWWREFKSNVTKVEEVAFNNQIEYHSIFTGDEERSWLKNFLNLTAGRKPAKMLAAI